MGPFEYKHVWLFHMPAVEKGDVPISYPERVARNIPSYEVDGWRFVCMVNSENGLFRRRRSKKVS